MRIHEKEHSFLLHMYIHTLYMCMFAMALHTMHTNLWSTIVQYMSTTYCDDPQMLWFGATSVGRVCCLTTAIIDSYYRIWTRAFSVCILTCKYIRPSLAHSLLSSIFQFFKGPKTKGQRASRVVQTPINPQLHAKIQEIETLTEAQVNDRLQAMLVGPLSLIQCSMHYKWGVGVNHPWQERSKEG